MRDFTLTTYLVLLEKYLDNGYHLCSYEDYLVNSKRDEKFVILRHDVDKKPCMALQTARLESKLYVNGTYYFRIVKESFDEGVIREIADLGHEIGYHYEDLTLCKGDFEKAVEHFKNGLERIRRFYPVKTICMHGSPLSKWDNRLLWEKYDYRDFGIMAEPYFDTDFKKVFYLTDTGRKWDGRAVSVRDKVGSAFTFQLRSTPDIITTIQKQELPPLVMQTIHPQRWHNNIICWAKELILQNSKNIIKKHFLKRVNYAIILDTGTKNNSLSVRPALK